MAALILIASLIGLIAGSTLVPTPEEVRASFKQAQKFYGQEDYKQAIENYERINNIESDLLVAEEITEEIGEIEAPIKEIALYQTGNSYFKQAEEAQIKSFRTRQPERKAALEEEAKAGFRKSASYFRRSEETATSPKLKALARNRLVSVLYESGDYEEVIREGKAFEELYPDNRWLVNVLYNAGWAYFDTEQYEESIEAFQRLVRHFPAGYQAERALFQIGEAYFNQGKFEEAAPWYQDVVDRQRIDQMSERELLRMRREKIAGLVDETALELAAKAQIKVGDCYAKSGNSENAVEAYKKVINAFAQEQRLVSEGYIRLADMYYDSGDYEGAVRTYHEAIDGSNNRYFQASMQSLLAEHYYKTENYIKAIEEYELYLDAYVDVASAAGFSPSWAEYKVARSHFEVAERYRLEEVADSAAAAYDRAIGVYGDIERDYPESDLAMAATKFNTALCFQMKGLLGDQDGVARALEIYQVIVDEEVDPDYLRSALLQMARIKYQDGEFEDAISAYNRILKDFPDAAERHAAQFELALCYRDLREVETAIAEFYKIDPNSGLLPKAMLEASRLLAEAQDYDGALAALDNGLKQVTDPEERGRFYYMKGRTLIEVDNYESAIEALAQASAASTDKEIRQGADYGRGVSLLKLRRYGEAVAILKPLLESDNEDLVVSTRRMIGLAHLEMGREEEAINDYTALVESAKDLEERAEHLVVLTELYYGIKDYGKVEEICREIIALDIPESRGDNPYFLKEKAYFLLGDTFNQRQDIDALISIYKTALNKYPDSYYSGDMSFILGQVLFEKENLQETTRVLSQYLERFPRHPNRSYGMYYLGYALFNLTQFERAAEVFANLASEYSRTELAPDALFRAGEARYNLEEFEKALTFYTTLLDEFPNADLADDAAYNLAWSLFNLQREEEAMAAFQRMADDYPASPLASKSQFTVGDFLYNEERYEEAIEIYEAVLRRFPDSEEAEKIPELLADLKEVVAYVAYAEVEAVFAEALESGDKDKFREAIEGFNEITQKYPGTESEIGALSNMGVCYESLGEWRKAVGVYDRVLNSFDGPDAEQQEAYRFARMHKEWIETARL